MPKDPFGRAFQQRSLPKFADDESLGGGPSDDPLSEGSDPGMNMSEYYELPERGDSKSRPIVVEDIVYDDVCDTNNYRDRTGADMAYKRPVVKFKGSGIPSFQPARRHQMDCVYLKKHPQYELSKYRRGLIAQYSSTSPPVSSSSTAVASTSISPSLTPAPEDEVPVRPRSKKRQPKPKPITVANGKGKAVIRRTVQRGKKVNIPMMPLEDMHAMQWIASESHDTHENTMIRQRHWQKKSSSLTTEQPLDPRIIEEPSSDDSQDDSEVDHYLEYGQLPSIVHPVPSPPMGLWGPAHAHLAAFSKYCQDEALKDSLMSKRDKDFYNSWEQMILVKNKHKR